MNVKEFFSTLVLSLAVSATAFSVISALFGIHF